MCGWQMCKGRCCSLTSLALITVRGVGKEADFSFLWVTVLTKQLEQLTLIILKLYCHWAYGNVFLQCFVATWFLNETLSENKMRVWALTVLVRVSVIIGLSNWRSLTSRKADMWKYRSMLLGLVWGSSLFMSQCFWKQGVLWLFDVFKVLIPQTHTYTQKQLRVHLNGWVVEEQAFLHVWTCKI